MRSPRSAAASTPTSSRPGWCGSLSVSKGSPPRIYAPRRAEVYQRLGIPTVATVRWTADQMLRKLLPEGAEPLWRGPARKIVLAEVAFSERWLGEKVKAVEMAAGTRIAFVDRLGEAMVPSPGPVLQEGEVLHIIP